MTKKETQTVVFRGVNRLGNEVSYRFHVRKLPHSGGEVFDYKGHTYYLSREGTRLSRPKRYGKPGTVVLLRHIEKVEG